MRPSIAALALLSGYFACRANAFITPASFASSARTQFPPQSSRTALSAWEDIVYNAQSVASSWATLSLKQGSIISSLPIMYGAGLLASVSPCVWGLLPLTMSSISTAAGQREDKQATLPTLAFAAGLASVFCTLGLLAASMGGIFGSFQGLTNVVVSVLSSGICLAMGLQLLDFIELPLPKLDVMQQHEQKSLIVNNTPQLLELDENGKLFLQPPPQKQRKQRQQEDGSLLQTFLLGGSSALVSSPCATPVLTSILAFVSNTHNPVVGAGLLLGYTLGYSTPLLLVASTGGQILAQTSSNSAYSKIAPWITPATGGILLWYGTNGILTAIFGDPSMVGLAPILE